MKSKKKILVVLALMLGVIAIMGSCNTKKVACPAYSKVDVQQIQNNG
jgi:hypothetical protein